MGATAAPASRTAKGLRVPRSAAAGEGRPKIPLPIIELMTSAARLQRPITRTSPLASFGVTREFVSQSAGVCDYRLTILGGCHSVSLLS